MFDETKAYIEYLSKFRCINRPKMPKFDVSTYTDNEYRIAIHRIEKDFENVDDLYITERYLKGE